MLNAALGLAVLGAMGAGVVRPPVASGIKVCRHYYRSRRRNQGEGSGSAQRELRAKRRADRKKQNALTQKFKLDQQVRAQVAGCAVNELHNRKNRWVLNDEKFNAALQA